MAGRNIFRSEKLPGSELSEVQKKLEDEAEEINELPSYREDHQYVMKYSFSDEIGANIDYFVDSQLEVFDEGFRVIADRYILEEFVDCEVIYPV